MEHGKTKKGQTMETKKRFVKFDKVIKLQADKRGRVHAYRYYTTTNGRWVRMNLAQAEVELATGVAEVGRGLVRVVRG
jgi:hypothetical protein